jgi:hypothetical protein
MKLFTGWAASVGLVVAASAANAQMPAPTDVGRAHYQATSDVQGPNPYAGMPAEAPATRYGPALLPPQEVYAVLRESGFSPLGIPQQRGYVYVIAVVDRAGEDGRLMIDARNGRIIRFLPAFRMGAYYDQDYPPPYGAAGPGRYGADGPRPYGAEGPGRYGAEGPGPYGPVGPGRYGPEGPGPYGAVGPGRYGAEGPGPYGAAGPGAAGSLPPMTDNRSAPRPPASVPRVASRAPVPAPKPAELAVKPAPQPMQQSAAVQAKPAAAPAAGQAKPAPTIQATEEMPKVQGLE